MADCPTYQVADIPMIWKRQAGTGGAGAAFHGYFLIHNKKKYNLMTLLRNAGIDRNKGLRLSG